MKKDTTHHEIIEMAWADEVSFDAIEFQTGLSEKEVIAIIRANLKKIQLSVMEKKGICQKINALKEK